MDTTLLGQSPPYTYPNPTRYFIFNFLIISIIYIENKCCSDAIWGLKREEKSLAKGRFELRSIASSTHFTIYATETDAEQVSFYNVDYLNHTLVGGVSVNRHCVFFYKWELLNILNQLHKFIESALIICCFNYVYYCTALSLYFFLLQQIIIWQTVWCFKTLIFILTEASRINTNLFVLQCVSFCRVLDLSCSLCPSINSVSADFTSSWCSDARLHL